MAGSDIVAQKTRVQGVGLVRNKYGEPQFNDYNDISPVFYDILTTQDWIYIKAQRVIE
tara:strand:+ start:902 stop:1075 length:174 start_codon:yes stop_codon:yes gene_type:complete